MQWYLGEGAAGRSAQSRSPSQAASTHGAGQGLLHCCPSVPLATHTGRTVLDPGALQLQGCGNRTPRPRAPAALDGAGSCQPSAHRATGHRAEHGTRPARPHPLLGAARGLQDQLANTSVLWLPQPGPSSPARSSPGIWAPVPRRPEAPALTPGPLFPKRDAALLPGSPDAPVPPPRSPIPPCSIPSTPAPVPRRRCAPPAVPRHPGVPSPPARPWSLRRSDPAPAPFPTPPGSQRRRRSQFPGAHLLLDGAAAVGVLGVLVEVAHGGVPGRGVVPAAPELRGAEPGAGCRCGAGGGGGAGRCGAVRRCPPGSHTAARDGAAVKGRAGRSGAERSATSRSCGASAPQPQPEPPLPVPPPRTEQRGRDPPACPARGRPRPPPPPIPARPGPPGPRGGFFLLLGSSYFNYFFPLLSTKNFVNFDELSGFDFLKGPAGL